jgi:hypothetical protein
MSKSNLERVQPTPGECTFLSWEPNPKNHQFNYDAEHELMGQIRKKITDIWAAPTVIVIPKIWQMHIDIPILPESVADLDDTVIPFWVGIEPQKTTWRTRVVNWLTR